MKKIIFENADHEIRYNEILSKMSYHSNMHKAIAYLLALMDGNAEDIYDFSKNQIINDGLQACWQTGGSVRATKLIYSMWNGPELYPEKCTIDQIFGYSRWDKFFIEALKIYADDTINMPDFSKLRFD